MHDREIVSTLYQQWFSTFFWASAPLPIQVQVQGLFVTYTIIQRVLTSSEMWVRSAPWTVQYYRKKKNNTKKYT